MISFKYGLEWSVQTRSSFSEDDDDDDVAGTKQLSKYYPDRTAN